MRKINLQLGLIVLSWALIGAASLHNRADGQTEKKKSATGVWKVTLSDKDFLPVDLILYQEKAKLLCKPTFFSDPTGEMKKGEFRGDEFTVPITLLKLKNPKEKSGETVKVDAELKGRLTNHKLVGSVVIGDKKVKWEATALPSIWVCGNHDDPAHSATSESQMRDLSKTKGCQLWHTINTYAGVADHIAPTRAKE